MAQREEKKMTQTEKYLALLMGALLALLLTALVVMWCWNAVFPEVMKTKKLQYVQALMLVLLVQFLFGGAVGAGACAQRCTQRLN